VASSESDGLVKVVFDLNDSELPYAVETVWAEPIGQDRYRIRNVPMFAKGVSEQDTVFATLTDDRLHVNGIADRGGHSTYRIFLKRPVKDIEKDIGANWAPLADLGCTYEKANDRLIGVDVPPAADIYAVYAILQDGEGSGLWEFEEGHCGHPLRS
jgi:Domain of unknown function (DUF4265)